MMLKRKQKYTVLLCLTAVLVIIAVLLFFVDYPSQSVFSVVIRYEDGEQKLSCWDNGGGELYVFLPGGIEMEDARLVKQTRKDILINGQAAAEEVLCSAFVPEVPYELTYTAFGKKESKTLTILRSDGLPSLFVSTEYGSNDYLHENKNNKESGSVSIYTADGELEYQGVAESIGGRGNSTWDDQEKKPYNIVLAEQTDLFNMGKGTKWVLLANASDSTLMRNKIVYDFAQRIGLAYSPESRWISLYMNGEYRGLYQLTEAVEIGEDRVDISQTEGVILAVETERILQEKNDTYFVTEVGLAVEVRSPKEISGENLSDLEVRVQSMENALLAKDGVDSLSGSSWKQLIDLDSWTKKYLIEEVFGNLDAFVRSSYFYYADSLDGLFAGPVWDFDMCAGNESSWQLQKPNVFWANRSKARPEMTTPWIDGLCEKEEFYQNMQTVYRLVFLPELENLFSTVLPEYVEEISQGAKLDKIRWKSNGVELSECVNALQSYMEQRIDLLNKIWINEQDYHVVRAGQQWGGYYAYYVVFTGEQLTVLPEFDDTEIMSFVGWYDANTGDPVDTEQLIVEDMDIYAKWVDNPSKRFNQIVKLIPLAVIGMLGLALTVVELRRWRKYGKGEGNERTKISP